MSHVLFIVYGLVLRYYRVAQKSKPLPYDQKIVLNRCQWDWLYCQIKSM